MAATSISPLRNPVICLVYVPAVALLGMLIACAVDAPFEDDWGMPGLLYKAILEDRWSFYNLFFAQSLESREAFLRMIYVGLGFTVGWRSDLFVLLDWVFAMATFVPMLLLLRRVPVEGRWVLPGVALLVGGLLFSPAQYKNWLWPMQLAQFIPPACVATGLLLQVSGRGVGGKILGSAALASVSTFSAPQGMLCWGLLFPFLVIPASEWRSLDRGRRRRIVAWLSLYTVLAAGVVAFYFWDYEKPTIHPPLDAVLADPLHAVGCFLAYIGAPFAEYRWRDGLAAMAIGCGFLALLALALKLCWDSARRGSCDVVRSAWPWICFTGYGIGVDLLTTVGRCAMDLQSFMAPRYNTSATWVATGVVGLGYTLWAAGCLRDRGRIWTLGLRAAAVTVAFLTAYSWYYGTGTMHRFSAMLRQNHLTMRLLDAIPQNPLWSRVTHMPDMQQTARFLAAEGLLRIDLVGPWITEKLLHPDPGDGGRFRVVSEAGNRLRLTGHAILPDRDAPADYVVLAYPDPSGRLVLLTALTNETPGFDDVVDNLQPHALQLFAVDDRSRRLFRMTRED